MPEHCAVDGQCSQKADLVRESGFYLLGRTDKGFEQGVSVRKLLQDNSIWNKCLIFCGQIIPRTNKRPPSGWDSLSAAVAVRIPSPRGRLPKLTHQPGRSCEPRCLRAAVYANFEFRAMRRCPSSSRKA